VASPAGAKAVRTYGSLWMWPLADGQEVGDAMGMDPCEAPVALEPQGESFAFTADNIAYLTVDEQDNTIHEARP